MKLYYIKAWKGVLNPLSKMLTIQKDRRSIYLYIYNFTTALSGSLNLQWEVVPLL